MDNVWDAFRTGQQTVLAPQLANVQTATGLMGILQAQQGILAQKQKLDRENQFRSELQQLGPNATQDSLANVAAKYAPAADVLKSQQSSLDRKAQIDATKQMAMSRLMQTAQQNFAVLDLKQKAAQTAEEKFHWQQQQEAFRANLQKQAADIAAGRFTYDTGMTLQPFAGVPPTPSAPPAAPGNATISPTVSPLDVSRISDPQERAAAMAALQGGRFSAPNPANMQSVSAPAPAQAMPVAFPSPQPTPTTRDATANMDANDLRARFAQPAPLPAPAPAPGPVPTAAVTAPTANAAPNSPPRPTLADAPPELSPKDKRKWLMDATKASVAGSGRLTPEALKFTAEQYLAGDSKAITGYARDQATKSALQNEIAKQAFEKGIDGKLMAAIMGEYQGFVSGQRVLGTREAQLSIAADVTSKFVPIAIEASEKFDRTGWKSLNDVVIAAESRTANPDLRRFAAANNALINVYARAINPNGVATVSDKDHAREILSTAFSKGDYRAGAEQLKMEVDTELKSPGSVKSDMRARFTGAADRRAQEPIPGIRASDQDLINKYLPR